jgi:hypothetical protein
LEQGTEVVLYLINVLQVEQLRSQISTTADKEEMEALETIAIQLAQERSEALTEIEELKRVRQTTAL